eukprot:4242150-Amphidinium_carterae.1
MQSWVFDPEKNVVRLLCQVLLCWVFLLYSKLGVLTLLQENPYSAAKPQRFTLCVEPAVLVFLL